MCLDEVVSNCEFIASIQPLKQAFLRAQQIKPRTADINDDCKYISEDLTSSIKVRHPDHNVCPNINCWKS